MDRACAALLEKGIEALTANRLDESCDAFTEAAATASSALLQPSLPSDVAAALRVIQGRSYGNLANIFGRRDELDGALMFSHKALSIFREIAEPERCANVLFNLAVYSERLGRLEEALKYMEEVLQSTADPERIAQATKWINVRRARAAAVAAEPSSEPEASIAVLSAETMQPAALPLCQTLFCPTSIIDAACFGDGAAMQPQPSSSVTPAPSPGSGIATPMLEFGFENLWYADVLARNDREAALLDAVDASLKARANAAEAYARGLAESASALSAPLLTTGLGIGRTLNGAGRAPVGVGAAVRSAFSFLTGSGSNSSSSGGGGTAASQHAAAASADVTFGGDEGESHTSVISGGFDSLHNALAMLRRCTHKARNAECS